MSADTGALSGLAQALGRAGGVDEIAAATLHWVTSVEGVTRAGLALTVVGGRQLRFLSSDARHLGPPPDWCLIDAYERLPLNDAVRTGRAVFLETSASLGLAYPELAERQDRAAVQSLVAVALTSADERIGGLLAYCDRELHEFDSDLSALLANAASRVTGALIAARAADIASASSALVEEDASLGDAPASSPTASCRLPDDATAPGTARTFLKEALREWGADQDIVDSALLCTSEIVTNVVMHVQQSSVITARRHDDRLIVHVDQPASSHDPVIQRVAEHDDPLVVAGRGLAVVDAIASRWGTETTSRNVRVWFELELTG
jgi:anti-sigma regulatory factor (Ser/Thr protein kinase)